MKNNDVETLDFEDETSIETIDYEQEVSNSIDDMLNLVMPKEKKETKKEKIPDNLNKEKLDLYTPSIKDFNIKNRKTKNIVKKVMVYSIIFILFTFEFFLNKAGQTLNELKVYAADNQPIMISKNNKYGYISNFGDVIVNPKYSYAEEFNKGYAIVKDANGMPLIIDKAGKEVVPTGNYFTLTRTKDDIIVSKTTKKGLKYGILNNNLKTIVDYKYDIILYQNDVYTFVKGNTVGILNKEGKEIYTYKLSDLDDKLINVSPSLLSNDEDALYAVVTVNHSSVIVNLNDGKVVSKPTVNSLVPLSNNVFYELKGDNKEYYYVYNNKITVDSIDYKALDNTSLKQGILKGLRSDLNYDIINGFTGDILIENTTLNDMYFGDNVFIYKDYDYKTNKEVFNLIKEGKEVKSISDIVGIKKGFKNGFAIIIYDDNKYGYINENGDVLNDTHYVTASAFASYGDAVCKTDSGYGVINKKGDIVVDFKYKKIISASDKYKENTYTDDHTIFYAGLVNNYYNLFDRKGKKVNNKNYVNVSFNKEYGVLKVSSDTDDYLLLSESQNTIDLVSFNSNYKAYENYVKVDNNYYNYNGKLIYMNKENNGDANE